MTVWTTDRVKELASHIELIIKKHGFIVLIPGSTELSNVKNIKVTKVNKVFEVIGERVKYLDCITTPDKPTKAAFIVGTNRRPKELWKFWSKFITEGQKAAAEANDDVFITNMGSIKKQVRDGLETKFNIKLGVDKTLN